MRIFSYQFQDTFTGLYQFILSALIHEPDYKTSPRGLPIHEIVNATILVNPTDCHIDFAKTMAPERQVVYDKYCKEELEWYLSGNTKASSAPSKFWNQLADPNGEITSNYGHMMLFDKVYPKEQGRTWNPGGTSDATHLIFPGELETAFERVVATLQKDPDSRQAIVHYNQPRHCYPQNRDFPCTVCSQFFIRDGKLNMTTYQRSMDCILGMCYDIPWNCYFMKMVKDKLPFDLVLGTFTHVVGSLHLYEKNIELAKKIISTR